MSRAASEKLVARTRAEAEHVAALASRRPSRSARGDRPRRRHRRRGGQPRAAQRSRAPGRGERARVCARSRVKAERRARSAVPRAPRAVLQPRARRGAHGAREAERRAASVEATSARRSERESNVSRRARRGGGVGGLSRRPAAPGRREATRGSDALALMRGTPRRRRLIRRRRLSSPNCAPSCVWRCGGGQGRRTAAGQEHRAVPLRHSAPARACGTSASPSRLRIRRRAPDWAVAYAGWTPPPARGRAPKPRPLRSPSAFLAFGEEDGLGGVPGHRGDARFCARGRGGASPRRRAGRGVGARLDGQARGDRVGGRRRAPGAEPRAEETRGGVGSGGVEVTRGAS